MSLVAAERIKLFSTRSPWWCALVAIALPIGFAALLASQGGDEVPLTVGTTQAANGLGRAVIMVMAALAITTEYRFGTIRSTFQATPNRVSALLAKTAVVTTLAAVIGELVAFGSWAVCRWIKPEADLALDTADDWRSVAGVGLVFALTAVLALGVGILVRQTAGAVALLLVYSQLVEGLVTLIPRIGDDIHQWLPFFAADQFIGNDASGQPPRDLPLSPWGYLAYFAVIAVAVLAVAIITANRRDA
ncbi:hypothetical protein [Actinokineospora iranica]|uniref:ABC-2 type transport system permease protein n=1 Tax=Actinokineospora iranica TaxID=1271860 RepID=A0A1G6PNP0_9PSEU|nr:hypothetical protein [Actinokineospora iranica]SDC81689.1 ABC-2 type transport system permease protein [Actinokineospora iranica]